MSGGSGACLGASNKELQPAHEIIVSMRAGKIREVLRFMTWFEQAGAKVEVRMDT